VVEGDLIRKRRRHGVEKYLGAGINKSVFVVVAVVVVLVVLIVLAASVVVVA